MKRFTLTLSVLFVLALLLTACQPLVAPVEVAPAEEVSAVSVPSIALDPTLVAEIEGLIEQTMADNQIPGFAISIVKDGQPAYVKSFGVAELDSDKAMTPQSLFQACSTSKTVVAMAIMQLVEQGLIGLDDPVTDYLPYFSMEDDAYKDITIRQLLAHRAGLPNKAGDAIILFQTTEPRYDDAALEDYVHSMSEYELLFAPGEDYSYSGPGFDVLGDVIAKVSGQSFETYMTEHVLSPLGMEDSTFLLPDADSVLLTTPHMYDEDGNAETIDFYPYDRRSAPSGGLYTSVDDLSRMAMAHLNGGELDGTTIVSPAAYDEMWTPYSETGWAEWFGPTWADYGLGWLMGETDGHMVYNHTGANSGYQSHLLVVPDENLAIVGLVNVFDRDEGSFHAYAITDEVMKILLGMKG